MTPAEIEQGRRLVERAEKAVAAQEAWSKTAGDDESEATEDGWREVNDNVMVAKALLSAHAVRVFPALLDAYEAAVAERSVMRRLAVRSALCLSGFVGEGICVDGFEEPDDVYLALVQELELSEADDDDLRNLLSGGGA